jgi:predicted acyltransferase
MLSTLPAIATTLLGVLAGLWLQRCERTAAVTRSVCCKGLALAGVVALALGALWSPWFPINKKLWTSSYVLFAGGWTLLLLALFYWFIDVRRLQQRSRAFKTLLWPWLVFGSNALTAYIFSEILVESLIWWKVGTPAGGTMPALASAYLHLFARHGSTENTSLAFAIAFVVVCFVPNWLLWRRRIFLRV